MTISAFKLLPLLLAGSACFGQTFQVTGTAIPQSLVRMNYGKIPNGISAWDLSICNVTNAKQSVVSSAIYQALASSNNGLQPIGRQIMLAPILRNQNHSAGAIAGLILNSATGVFSVLGSASRVPAGVLTGAAVASMSAQSVLNHLAPVLTNDQLEKFETEVLEPALVLDGGSCVERTVFALSTTGKPKAANLSFHVR
ncbi:MAG: hypothetical protein JO270_07185 [Acidobacteriaceae bacterium]|nr:hypothetical protein [Acidobacteriaceae bacterium]